MTVGSSLPSAILGAALERRDPPRAKRDPEAFLAKLHALESIYVEHGLPSWPAWWWATVERFERSRKRTRNVRKGRRVFASTAVAPRLAVCEMLYGDHPHVPGTPPLVYAFLSVKRDEASKRLRGVRALLDLLGEPYDEKGDTIELRNRPALFAVLTANYRLSVGDTIAFCWCDEVARWRDDDGLANPAEQVIGSLKPALATLPNATLWLVSSPLSTEDYHAKQFDRGETPDQCVAFGETWTINPTLTEAQCRELEPDQKLFLREYAAIPQASVSGAFDYAVALRCFRVPPAATDYARAFCVIDASSGGGDAFTWTIGQFITPAVDYVPRWLTKKAPRRASIKDDKGERWVDIPGEFTEENVFDDRGIQVENPEWHKARRPILVFGRIRSVEGRFAGSVSGSEIVSRIAAECHAAGVEVVLGDQREAFFATSEFMRHKLRFVPLTWTNQNKIEAVTRLKRHFAEQTICLPPDAEKLKKEIAGYTERITASGALTYSARGTGHDDQVSLLITAALGELERLVPGSPLYLPNYRHEVPR